MTDITYPVNIYKDGSYFMQITMDENLRQRAHLRDLENGIYTLQFKSKFNKLITDTVSIAKDTMYYTFLYSDDFGNTGAAFRGYIDSLKDNESFFIEYESYGCYHWEIQTLRIDKKDNQYYATLSPEKKIRGRLPAKRGKKTMLLSAARVDSLINFQLDTYRNAAGLSGTEIIYYTFRYRNSQVKFADSDENEKRYYNLLQALYCRYK